MIAPLMIALALAASGYGLHRLRHSVAGRRWLRRAAAKRARERRQFDR